jgi:6-phosphogluconolactonase
MPYYMYVSLQDDDKIRVFTMDAEAGQLTPKGDVPVSGGPSPLTMSPDRMILYVGHRNVPAISSFRIDPDIGGLTQSGTVSPEAPPTFLSTDRKGRFLRSAYYQSARAHTWPGPPLPQWGVEPTHLHLSSGRHLPLTMMPKSLKYKTQI